MDHEKAVEPDLVLGSTQGMRACKKDTEDMVTVGSRHSAKVAVNTGRCHG